MAAPTIQAQGIVFSDVTATTLTAEWTRGDGDFVVVFATAAESGDLSDGITDNTTYAADPKFGAGSSPAGYDTWYCVYNGFGVRVTITGLLAGTAYTIQAFEYNGTTGEEAYLAAVGKDSNPASVSTSSPGGMVMRSRRRRWRSATGYGGG